MVLDGLSSDNSVMPLRNIGRKFSFAALVSLLTIGSAAHGQNFSASREFNPSKANRLMGMTVEDGDGQRIGQVRNIVVDVQSGCAEYIIVGSGGFLGIRTKLRAVPLQVMSPATAKRNVVEIAVPKVHWNDAPTFRVSDLDALAQPNRQKQIADFYKQAVNDGMLARVTESQARSAPVLSATGRATQPNHPGKAQLELASEIIGRTVVDRDRKRLGDLSDLLLFFHDHSPAFALFTTGKWARDGERTYAVPLRDLDLSENNKARLQIDPTSLDRAEPFDARALESAVRHPSQAPVVFSYTSNPG